MPRRVYRPTPVQTVWLYVRYRLIETSAVGLACDGGLQSWQCEVRRSVAVMFDNSAFGICALIAAALNLVRPSFVLFTLGLAAGGSGVVLYNTAISSLALALFILSLARPAPEPD
jgi:hypothetical protein